MNDINNNNIKFKRKILSRSDKITFKHLKSTFDIHNGKLFVSITVNPDMVGHKFGEFVSTRKIFKFKKKKS